MLTNQKIPQQTKTRPPSILRWLYTMQSLHLQHHRELVGKWKRFSQLSVNHELQLPIPMILWLLYHFYIIPKSQSKGTKQSTGILVGLNGKPQTYGRRHWCKEQLFPDCSSPHPTLLFFADFKAPEHSISYRLKHLERPMSAFWQQIKKMKFLWQQKNT